MQGERVVELIGFLEATLAEARAYGEVACSHDPWSPYEPFLPVDERGGARARKDKTRGCHNAPMSPPTATLVLRQNI